MKKILAILMVAVAFTSCGSDDDSSDSVSINGTWNLTYFGGSTATDLNGDGSANANIITETGCYTGDTIVFSENGSGTINNTTYAEIDVVVENDSATYSVSCESDPSSDAFTWTQNGNAISVTQSGTTLVGTIDGDELTFIVADGSSVEVIGDDGVTSATVTEDLRLTYEKQ